MEVLSTKITIKSSVPLVKDWKRLRVTG